MILLNALPCVSARVIMPKTGAWFVDLDLDLVLPVLPTGPAVVTLGLGGILRGTIDDRASGRVGSKAKIRVVAGGGGWDTPVPALHLHNDAGVFSTAVYAVTAASVGEVPVVELGPPKLFGVDYVRMQGPASRVFAGVNWWVDILGITHTGIRPPLPPPPPPVLDILEWHATAKVAVLSCDILIQPGMVIADPLRFGIATIDDVEHTFDEKGARAIAWCSTPSISGAATALLASPPPASGTKLVRALGALARESAGVSALKQYAYRVVVQGVDGRVNLMSVDLLDGAPLFLVMIDIWAGLPGLSCKLTPTSRVLVTFINGDPGRPIISGFDPKNPPALEVSIDAIRIALGTIAADPVAKATGTQAQILALTTAVAAITAWIAAVTALAATPPTSTTFTLFGLAMAAPGATVAGICAGQIPLVASAVAAATSTKTFTD